MRTLFLFILLFPWIAVAQLSDSEQLKIDSLKEVIATTEQDTIKIKAWKQWDDMIYAFDPVLDYALNKKIDSLCALNLEKEVSDEERYFYLKARGGALNVMGIVERDQSKFGLAIEHLNESLKVNLLINDKQGIANALTNLGNCYTDKGDYHAGIDYQMRSLRIEESRGNEIGMAHCYNNIGIVYEKLQEYDKAIEYYSKSLHLKESMGDRLGMASSLNNIGVIYHLAKKQDSALFYHRLSLEIEIEYGNQAGISRSYSNMGDVYKDLGEYDSSLFYFKESLKLQEELDDRFTMANTYLNLGHLMVFQSKDKQGVEYYKKSLEIAEDVEALLLVSNASEALYEFYKNQGNSALALEMHEKFIAARDSTLSEEAKQELIRQEYQYEHEKDSIKAVEAVKVKEAELQFEKAESSKQRLQAYYLYAGIIVLILFTIFIFNRFRITRQQKIIIEDQKAEVDKAYDQLEEKNSEILDSITYAKRIQTAILPSLQTVKANFPESFVFYRPKDIVAGDFYWLERQNGHLLFAVADCTGHGVPGAMVSVICNNGLNRSVREHRLVKPADILHKTRDIVVGEFEKSEEDMQDGMDINLISIPELQPNENQVSLQYGGANNPLWIYDHKTKTLSEVKADKHHIGWDRRHLSFNSHEVTVNKGDSIYLFSDGYADQFGGEKGKKFKTSQFKQLLTEIGHKPMQEQQEILVQRFEEWKGEIEQIDDVCVVGIRF